MRTNEPKQSDQLIIAPSQTTTHRRVTRRRLLLVIGGLVLVALLGYFAIGAYVAAKLTQVERKAQSTSPAEYGLPFEDATVRARDGLALAGWFIPATDSDRAVVLVHGHTSCRSSFPQWANTNHPDRNHRHIHRNRSRANRWDLRFPEANTASQWGIPRSNPRPSNLRTVCSCTLRRNTILRIRFWSHSRSRSCRGHPARHQLSCRLFLHYLDPAPE